MTSHASLINCIKVRLTDLSKLTKLTKKLYDFNRKVKAFLISVMPNDQDIKREQFLEDMLL